MKNILVVTGGAGFVGSNLIELLIKKTKYKIISIDNYSSGLKKNHIKNLRINYINSETKQIYKVLNKYKKKLMQFFILGNLLEFIRVLKNLMNVIIQILLVLKRYLNFV